jgi:flagellar biosynthesis anti-sigma factor FlgM
MQIDGNNLIEGQKLLNRTDEVSRNKDTEKKEEAQKTESGRDRVSLSGKSREISDFKGLIDGLPDIRRDKVEGLKHAIDTGSYNFDPVKVVEKILAEEF